MKSLKWVVLVACLLLASFAGATTVTFDDLGTGPIQNGYAGLNWENFWTIPGSLITGSAYPNSVVSDPNIAFNGSGYDAAFSSPTAFAFNSAYFGAGWLDRLQITVAGYLNGVLVDSKNIVVDTNGATLSTFNWKVDKVTFSTVGPAGSDPNHKQFAMDDLETSPVPEPASITLFGLGATGLLARFRRKAKKV